MGKWRGISSLRVQACYGGTKKAHHEGHKGSTKELLEALCVSVVLCGDCCYDLGMRARLRPLAAALAGPELEGGLRIPFSRSRKTVALF